MQIIFACHHSNKEIMDSTEEIIEKYENLILLEEELEDLADTTETPSKVSYIGQDFDIFGLVRRLNNKTIIIPQFQNKSDNWETEAFQRGFVWNKTQMDRFIESILLEYPIPGIFLVKQTDKRNLVLDGQQRLTTLKKFLANEFSLGNSVSPEFKGKYFRDLDESVQRSFEDYSIQTTTLSSLPDSGDMRAIYQIFERLNSGGTQLTAHEIRMALYAGPIVNYIQGLNAFPAWRNLYGPENTRVRDHELISRIIAMFLGWKSYRKPLKTFINEFYIKNHEEVAADTYYAGELFKSAASRLDETIGRSALRPLGKQLNTAWTDALFVGIMNSITKDNIKNSLSLQSIFTSTLENSEMIKHISGPTSDESSVSGRMKIAISHFTGEPVE